MVAVVNSFIRPNFENLLRDDLTRMHTEMYKIKNYFENVTRLNEEHFIELYTAIKEERESR